MKLIAIGAIFIPGGGEGAAEAEASQKVESFVYKITNQEGKEIYVGITNDLRRRGIEHGADLIPIAKGLAKNEARALEQALIERFGMQKNGGQLRNLRNSISPRNHPIYRDAIDLGQKLLESIMGPRPGV